MADNAVGAFSLKLFKAGSWVAEWMISCSVETLVEVVAVDACFFSFFEPDASQSGKMAPGRIEGEAHWD